ncbi:hypothetical protein AM501_17490 [Aneurinibacillus migulanus]|uniref:hypothetical protein n=1 Tax=Aneurinibacillus migulanus TaxID=47500 RepID=UPI0005B9C115|nr:hypothetical protein [Aneurinibacillus migulanus]KIV56384.1 hypothetical protein TS64_10150 [Aneurinibacillus migulanus]KPD07098.1 hypothetical protein AM501_17490 [Aneurinibacillus migulanus]
MFLQLMDAVKTSLIFGIQRFFEVGLVFAILCFIGTFFLPEVKLKGREYFDEAEQTFSFSCILDFCLMLADNNALYSKIAPK